MDTFNYAKKMYNESNNWLNRLPKPMMEIVCSYFPDFNCKNVADFAFKFYSRDIWHYANKTIWLEINNRLFEVGRIIRNKDYMEFETGTEGLKIKLAYDSNRILIVEKGKGIKTEDIKYIYVYLISNNQAQSQNSKSIFGETIRMVFLFAHIFLMI